jgi:hypothetical protein
MGRLFSCLFVSACAVLLSSSARAQSCLFPHPYYSTVPDHVTLAGTHAGEPDPSGVVEVVVRSICSTPVPHAQVVFSFEPCPGSRQCNVNVPGQTLICGERAIWTLADAQGIARATLLGSGSAMGGDFECSVINVYADAVLLKTVRVAVLDQNGAITTPGLELTDLIVVLRDLGVGIYRVRSDYDYSGTLSVVDFALLLQKYGSGASATGCEPHGFCP